MANRIEIMWGTAILDEGFTSIPNMVIRNWAKVGVKPGEWALITAILTYKHDQRDPYPSQEQLAEDLNCHPNQIKRWIKGLKDKKMIRVGRRRNVANKRWDNSVYNFKPLLDAIMKLKGEDPLPDSQPDYEIEWEDWDGDENPQTHFVSVDSQQNVSMGPQQNVSMKKKKEKEKNEKIYTTHPSVSSKSKNQKPKTSNIQSQHTKPRKNDLPEWVKNQKDFVPSSTLSSEQKAEADRLLKALGEVKKDASLIRLNR